MNILNDKTIERWPYTKLIISPKCPLHCHTFFEFNLCLSGSLKNTINDVEYTISKGSIMLLRPQDKHTFHCDGKHISRDIYVQKDTLKSICDCISPDLFFQLESEPLQIMFSASEYDLQLIENKLSLFNSASTYSVQQLQIAYVNVITEILNLWQQNQIRKTQNYPDWLIRLIRQINSLLFMTKSIDEIINSTNYSHGYVCREFKKYMKTTLQEYVSSVRFSYALTLLQTQENSITQIAEKLGYSSATNFVVAFKRKFNVTPAQWRINQGHPTSNKAIVP